MATNRELRLEVRRLRRQVAKQIQAVQVLIRIARRKQAEVDRLSCNFFNPYLPPVMTGNNSSGAPPPAGRWH